MTKKVIAENEKAKVELEDIVGLIKKSFVNGGMQYKKEKQNLMNGGILND